MEILELVHPGLYYHYRQGPLGTDIFVNRDFFLLSLKQQNPKSKHFVKVHLEL